jgi:hypothetical protein
MDSATVSVPEINTTFQPRNALSLPQTLPVATANNQIVHIGRTTAEAQVSNWRSPMENPAAESLATPPPPPENSQHERSVDTNQLGLKVIFPERATGISMPKTDVE